MLWSNLQLASDDDNDSLGEKASSSSSIWNPTLRRVMAGISSLGALETAYLTYSKATGQLSGLLCGAGDGGRTSCTDVLNGPYSYVPFTEIPLSVLGFLAYMTVIALSMSPLPSLENNTLDVDDSNNRVALTAVTTAMGTFSLYLMTLLFGILQMSCPYCVFSAACSILLSQLAWIGGCLPAGSKVGAKATSSSFLAATMAALLLFVSVDNSGADSRMSSSTGTLVASTASADGSTITKLYSPPAIETESSERAMQLAESLKRLDAKMYGAYWCSHCYDQKQVFGKQAFSKITYVECSKDGVNSQTKLCKSREVPGYPTWEIQGELYPGQQELDELEELVQSIRNAGSK